MLDRLLLLVPPPNTPIDAPRKGDWEAIEKRFTRLPTDYKRFLECYGTGSFCNFFTIFNPLSRHEPVNLISRAPQIRDIYLSLRTEFPDEFPHEFFPTPGGLLPAGATAGGTTIVWQTGEDCDSWTIGVLSDGFPRIEASDLGLVAWLVTLLQGQIRNSYFPDDIATRPLTFTPT
jgi:hypothetical protein